MIPSLSETFRIKVLQNGYADEDVEFLEKIAANHSDFRFVVGRKYTFRPPRTIVIGPLEPSWRLLLIHEVGHALCGHRSFRTDVERLKIEVQAWEKARELAQKYDIEYDEDLVQGELDTYRDWLHQKSRCPKCGLTRFQTPDSQYHCPLCEMS